LLSASTGGLRLSSERNSLPDGGAHFRAGEKSSMFGWD